MQGCLEVQFAVIVGDIEQVHVVGAGEGDAESASVGCDVAVPRVGGDSSTADCVQGDSDASSCCGSGESGDGDVGEDGAIAVCCGDSRADVGEPGAVSGGGDNDLSGEVVGGGWFEGLLDGAVGGADAAGGSRFKGSVVCCSVKGYRRRAPLAAVVRVDAHIVV